MTSDSSNSFSFPETVKKLRDAVLVTAVLLFFSITFSLCADGGIESAVNKKEKASAQPLPERKLPPIIKYSDYSILVDGKELKGFWKVVKWHAYFYVPAKEWNKPVFMKYQWYWFTDDGIIKLMSSQKSFKDREVAEKLRKSTSKLRYFFLQKGIMQVRSMENSKIHEQWRTAEVFKDIEFKTTGFNFKKGDIIQSLLDENGKVLYIRHMRRVSL
jgi:hypothetical protein